MSDCNFCSLQRMRARVPKSHQITILPDATWGGVNVYVHPADVDIRSLESGENGARAKYRSAWFMELPDHCCC